MILRNKIIASTLLLFTACNSILDNPQPEDLIPIESAFNSISDIELSLLGAYSLLRDIELLPTLYPDFISDNARYTGFLPMGPNNIPFSPFDGRINEYWLQNFAIINQVNLVLQSLGENSAFGDSEKGTQLEGEALFLRAITYFEMVRLFSKPFGSNSTADLGLPLLSEPTTSKLEIRFPVRSTVADTYKMAIDDLQKASMLLPAWISRGRANKYAALAYLARIHFQQKNYEMAAMYASQVRTEGNFTLNDNPAFFYDEDGSPEEIWAIVHSPQEFSFLNRFTQTDFMVLSEDLILNGFPNLILPSQDSLLKSENLTLVDLRKRNLTFSDTLNTYCLKYSDPIASDDGPILRLAECLLIEAEAKVMLEGVNGESLELLNTIRRRSLKVIDSTGNVFTIGNAFIEYKETDFSSVEELIDAIVKERRIEYFFEGNRFHDLMRLGRAVRGINYDDDALRWPIPQSEIDANSNLIQNPGY